ncbi:MAG TPA: dienelactone hydrolase family protein [Solirubrobacteraceae bacterium]|nr:dienelactone hydrolase family protein [Solirubrobacteraceae bacterium]
MRLQSEWIEYGSDGASVAAYLARAHPAAAQPLPGVLVIQEIWGPDGHICDVAQRLAEAGYLALAVDLYSHGGRPPELAAERIEAAKSFLDSVGQTAWMDPAARAAELAKLPAERAEQVGATLGALLSGTRPMGRYLADLRAAYAWLAQHPGCDGRVASVGFCLGGGLSAQLACSESALAAAVIFYGAAPAAEQVAQIACPLLGIYGAEDERINAGVPAFAGAMAAAGKAFEAIYFEGAGHAFFNDTRASYRAGPARSAWARTLDFLDRHTSPAGARSEGGAGR